MKWAIIWFLLSTLMTYILFTAIWHEPLVWDHNYRYESGETYATELAWFSLKVGIFCFLVSFLSLIGSVVYCFRRYRRSLKANCGRVDSEEGG